MEMEFRVDSGECNSVGGNHVYTVNVKVENVWNNKLTKLVILEEKNGDVR
jgi:hypothetical protein